MPDSNTQPLNKYLPFWFEMCLFSSSPAFLGLLFSYLCDKRRHASRRCHYLLGLLPGMGDKSNVAWSRITICK